LQPPPPPPAPAKEAEKPFPVTPETPPLPLEKA
jgi:hypothetical protein